MSLREEIDNYIQDIHGEYEPDVCDVDVILNLIEKRIDELYKQYEDDLKDTPKQSGYSDWAMGRLNGFHKVKEVLK